MKSLDIRIGEVSKDALYATALDNAASDLRGDTKEPEDADLAVIEHTIAKILLCIISDKETSDKYAERKAGEYREALEKEQLPFLIKVAREDFGMDIATEDSLRLHFIDFLEYKPDFLKLSQMNLLKGYVQLSKLQLSWVLKGAIERRILESIPKKGNFPEEFTNAANKLKGIVVREKKTFDMPKLKNISYDALPSCISGIIDLVGSGKANHNAHFVLVTFLLGLNLPNEAILDIFRRSPKFKDRIAQYQINFAKQRDYKCPGCESIKSYGLCTGQCPKGHPISNYLSNLRTVKIARKVGPEKAEKPNKANEDVNHVNDDGKK